MLGTNDSSFDFDLHSEIVNAVPDHIAVINMHGTIILTNKAWRLFASNNSGTDAKTGIGVNYLEVSKANQEVYIGIQGILEGKSERFTHEYPCHDRTGRERWFSLSVTPYIRQGRIQGAVIIHSNITDRQQYKARWQQSRTDYKLIFDHSHDLIKIVSPDGRIQLASPSHRDILGEDPDQIKGGEIFDNVAEEDLSVLQRLWGSLIAGESNTVKLELRKRIFQGGFIWLETVISAVRDEDNIIQQLIVISRDITQNKKYQEQLEHLAYHDVLTGLFNRRKFKVIVQDHLDAAVTPDQRMALLLIDLDGFKQINDKNGHDVGDELLKIVASRMLETFGEHAVCCRLGGDEFVVFLKALEMDESCGQWAQKLLDRLHVPCKIDDETFVIKCSIGISRYPESLTYKLLMKHADQALYKAKHKGRNRYELYSYDLTIESFPHE